MPHGISAVGKPSHNKIMWFWKNPTNVLKLRIKYAKPDFYKIIKYYVHIQNNTADKKKINIYLKSSHFDHSPCTGNNRKRQHPCNPEIALKPHEPANMARCMRVLSPDHEGTIYEHTCKAYHCKLLLSLKEKHQKRRSKNKVAIIGVKFKFLGREFGDFRCEYLGKEITNYTHKTKKLPWECH